MVKLDQARYRELAPKVCSLFGNPWWLDALCPNQWDAVVSESESGTILWPFHYKRKFGFNLISMPEVSLFMGPFTLGSPTENDWSEVIQILQSFDQIAYQSHFAFNPNKIQALNGFDILERTHFELKPNADFRTNYSSHTLRKLKKKKEEVVIKQTTELNHFFRLARESYKAQGTSPPYSNETLERLMQACIQNHTGFILEAHTPDGIQAAIWITFDHSTVYYFLSGTDRSMTDYGGATKLVDNALNLAYENGKDFNFYGSEIPGVARFMQGFGGKVAHSYLISHKKNKLLKQLRRLAIKP